jgi:hypothetical protein
VSKRQSATAKLAPLSALDVEEPLRDGREWSAMGMAITGVVVLAMPVGLAWWLALRLREAGESVTPAVRFLMRSGAFYLGLAILATAIGRPLGTFVFLVLFVLAGLVAVRLLLRLPGAARALPSAFRNLGDPAAWRGER